MAWALLPLAAVYALAMLVRRAGYRAGLARAQRLPVPVIVVGNVIVGGAGKTPTVLAVLAHLRAAGHRPGVVSRGHGRNGPEVHVLDEHSTAVTAGDEPLLIHRRGQVPVAVGRDRVAAASALLQAHPEIDVLVSDDGLQHLRLARDVEILVFDERGAGNGWWLPAGPLREAATRHADLVLYNAPHPSLPRPGFQARRRPGRLLRLAQWAADPHAAGQPWSALGTRRPRAAAGIAHPERFFDLLRQEGLQPITDALPDHHAYTSLPWPSDGTEPVLVTEKDAVKLAARWPEDPRLWVVTLDFQPEPGFFQALDQALAASRAP